MSAGIYEHKPTEKRINYWNSLKNKPSWNKGISPSKETREKQSLAKIGKPSLKKGKPTGIVPKSAFKKGGVAWNKGLKMPEEIRIKMRVKKPNATGEKSHLWKGGITPINRAIRHSLEYKLWRRSVFERDNFTCIWCGDKTSGNLNADHIKPFALFPELRFAIDNGRTLCVSCHKTTDTFGCLKNYGK